MTIVKELFNLLDKHNLTISSAESVTGGRFSNLIVNEPNASKFYFGSFICYNTEFKYRILNVSKNIDVVSKEMAIELSEKCQEILKTNLSISFTGNASASGLEMKRKGLVYIGITNGNITKSYEYISDKKNRTEIIDDISIMGIKKLLEFIKKNY